MICIPNSSFQQAIEVEHLTHEEMCDRIAKSLLHFRRPYSAKKGDVDLLEVRMLVHIPPHGNPCRGASILADWFYPTRSRGAMRARGRPLKSVNATATKRAKTLGQKVSIASSSNFNDSEAAGLQAIENSYSTPKAREAFVGKAKGKEVHLPGGMFTTF